MEGPLIAFDVGLMTEDTMTSLNGIWMWWCWISSWMLLWWCPLVAWSPTLARWMITVPLLNEVTSCDWTWMVQQQNVSQVPKSVWTWWMMNKMLKSPNCGIWYFFLFFVKVTHTTIRITHLHWLNSMTEYVLFAATLFLFWITNIVPRINLGIDIHTE
jgi:hypothetical protein